MEVENKMIAVIQLMNHNKVFSYLLSRWSDSLFFSLTILPSSSLSLSFYVSVYLSLLPLSFSLSLPLFISLLTFYISVSDFMN